ncbi:MAG: YcfL family protein [Verrucomicrobia bacterium]|nr:YcfL family protein [Verrucomicrobiota bacterium]
MKIIPLLAVMSCLLLALGCATNVNTVERANPQAKPDMIADKRIITDASLGGPIRIVSVNESIVSGNLKKVQVTLENVKNNTRRVSYKFEWIDQDGMATNSVVQSWQSLSFAGGETQMVSAVAISPKAVDFKLKLAEAN